MMKFYLNFKIFFPTEPPKMLTISANKPMCDSSVLCIVSFLATTSLLQRKDQKLGTKMKNRRGWTKYRLLSFEQLISDNPGRGNKTDLHEDFLFFYMYIIQSS